MTYISPIGGFFPLALPNRQEGKSSLFAHWVKDYPFAAFHTARAALAWLAESHKKLWIPAYACHSLACTSSVAFYPLREGVLSPDIEFLGKNLAVGDAVVGVDYFGALPQRAFIDFTKEHEDICWIEDRAQAADPGESWGDYLLYSPRKLLGTPEGGLLVAVNPQKPLPPLPTFAWHQDYTFITPSLMRLADQDEKQNATWYAQYQRVENAMTPTPLPMHDVSRLILEHTDAETIFAQRLSNYSYLKKRFQNFAFLPETTNSFVPFGFPIRVPNRDHVAKQLAKSRIFAATHWREMPSDPSIFKHEHHLSSEELTLPCDQRYGDADMARLAEALKSILG